MSLQRFYDFVRLTCRWPKSIEDGGGGQRHPTNEREQRQDDDLNAILVIVSFAERINECADPEAQAGLLSAVIAAFVVAIQPQLQPDPVEESAALLRVILYNMDKTAFGAEVPTVPKWTGPPGEIVATEVLLYLSLITTLSTAFLTLLVKQLGITAAGPPEPDVERGQGVVRRLGLSQSIRFQLLLLPLQLQAGLLCFGCALIVYLWNINVVISRIILFLIVGNVPFYLLISFLGLYDRGFPPLRPIRNLISIFSSIIARAYR